MTNDLPKVMPDKRTSKFHRLFRDIRMDFLLYVLLVPGIVYFAVFKYVPMYGLIIAFTDYNIVSGFGGATWIGFGVFNDLF